MNEYLASEHAKSKEWNDSPTKKLWSLENDDDECGIYEVNLCEFPAICIHEDSDWNDERLSPIFYETYNAIVCDLRVSDYLFESRFHITVLVCSIETKEDEFDLLSIDADLFTWESPLESTLMEFKHLSSMGDDLFTYNLLMSYMEV